MWKSGLQKVQQQIQEVLDCYVSDLPPDAIAGAETPLISHDEQASRGNSEQGEAGTATGQRLCISNWTLIHRRRAKVNGLGLTVR